MTGQIRPACITTVLVALEFQYRDAGRGESAHCRRIALFPGAWNPPTVAHLAIARAARRWAGEVIWILPRVFPHKGLEGAGFDARVAMVRRLASDEPGFSVAITNGGLYEEMADEAREFFGPGPEIALVCGRDAAERIAAWDYGRPGAFEELIERYVLLVAGRAGDYLPDARHTNRIICLTMDSQFSEVSSTEVRRRIADGEQWRHLVPDAIAETVSAAYGR